MYLLDWLIHSGWEAAADQGGERKIFVWKMDEGILQLGQIC